MHAVRQVRRHVARRPAPLTEPTSVTMAPGLRCAAISCATAPAGADRHAEDDEVGVLHGLGVGRRRPRSARPSSRTRCARRLPSVRWRRSRRARPCARAARAIERADQAEADQRQALEERASLHPASLRAMKSREAADDQAVGFLGADGHAQRVGQAVGGDPAQQQPARGEEGVGLRRRSCPSAREMDQHEIGDARRHLQAELADLLGQPGEPVLVVLRATLA